MFDISYVSFGPGSHTILNETNFRFVYKLWCTNDLNNVAFIALAVVMIFSLVRSHSFPTFMSAMGEQYIIFLVFFFIFTFSGLNESLLVCCIVIFNSKSSSSYTEFYCKMVTSNAISHMKWTYQHRYLCDLGSIVHHESP